MERNRKSPNKIRNKVACSNQSNYKQMNEVFNLPLIVNIPKIEWNIVGSV